jgi:hypothetical protein
MISHTYLLWILMSYGYSLKFIRLIKAIYKAFSLVQINGYIAGPFPAQCSIRQGCPLSMLLFTVALNPLIYSLHRHFITIRIGHWSKKIAEVAYTDLMIFVTAEAGIPKIKGLMSTHERATEARLNTSKSEALAIGSWYTLASVPHISYHQEVTILGFRFTSMVARSGHLTWAAGEVQALATGTCCRDPCLEQRIQYMHNLGSNLSLTDTCVAAVIFCSRPHVLAFLPTIPPIHFLLPPNQSVAADSKLLLRFQANFAIPISCRRATESVISFLKPRKANFAIPNQWVQLVN